MDDGGDSGTGETLGNGIKNSDIMEDGVPKDSGGQRVKCARRQRHGWGALDPPGGHSTGGMPELH